MLEYRNSNTLGLRRVQFSGQERKLVEFSGITNAHVAGVELLSRMRETGARLNAALPPEFRRVHSFNGDPGGSARSVAQHVADQHSL